MKPFVTIGGGVGQSFFKIESGISISVDDCAQTEILVCTFGADSGPGTMPGCAQASNVQTSILVPSSRSIADQNAIKSCRFSSNFKQIRVLSLSQLP